MQADAELVSMIVTVALAHDLENRDRLAACPVAGALIGAQHREAVSRPYFRRRRWQLDLGRKRRMIDQVWRVARDHRHKDAVVWVPRNIVGSDQGLMHDDVALRGGRIDEDQVTHGVGGSIAVVGDADLPWPVAGALDRVGAVDVVIHQALPRASIDIWSTELTEPILLVVGRASVTARDHQQRLVCDRVDRRLVPRAAVLKHRAEDNS